MDRNLDTTTVHRIHPVDAHVGARLRLRRKLIGMSQEQLADALGITFQQVQKYERGANRISASKLYDAAQALSVPIGFFFENLPEDGPIDEQASAFLYTPDAVPLAQAFARIETPSRRQAILDLMRELAEVG